MWWSFRQIEDPGNLVESDSHLGVLLISFFLTITGLLLFSFLIGIGANVVKEMMDSAREQPAGLQRHSILLNAGPSSEFFMTQIIDYSRKQLATPKWMVMSNNDESTGRKLREVCNKSSHINFRNGTAYNPQDLQKVDVSTARRFVILADHQDNTPDAETISAIMSARQLNPEAQIIAEIYNRKNSSAAETAASNSNVVVVETEYLLALLMANIIEMPEAFPVIEEMLNTEGQEMYSYVFDNDEKPLPREYFDGPDGYKKFVLNAYRKNGSVMLGYSPFRKNSTTSNTLFSINAMQFNPGAASKALLGVGSNFADIKEIAQCVARGELQEETPHYETPKFSLEQNLNRNRKVLVCGYRHRVAVIAEHLIHNVHGTEVFIMLNSEEEIDEAIKDMIQTGISLAKYHKNHYSLRYHGQFEKSGENQLIYKFDYNEGQAGKIHFIRGDWSSRDHLMKKRENYDIRDIDLMVIPSVTDEHDDPDSKAVLTLLKLENMVQLPEFKNTLKKEFRIFVEMVDILKAKLIENQFSQERCKIPVTVIPVERYRNTLIFYSTQIPGFGNAFMQLFHYNGAIFQSCEFVYKGENRNVSFEELLVAFQKEGRVLLALEIEENNKRRSILAPPPNSPDAIAELCSIRRCFFVGERQEL